MTRIDVWMGWSSKRSRGSVEIPGHIVGDEPWWKLQQLLCPAVDTSVAVMPDDARHPMRGIVGPVADAHYVLPRGWWGA